MGSNFWQPYKGKALGGRGMLHKPPLLQSRQKRQITMNYERTLRICQEDTHGLAGRVPHVVLRDGQLALGVPAHTAGEHREGHRALVVEHVLNGTS